MKRLFLAAAVAVSVLVLPAEAQHADHATHAGHEAMHGSDDDRTAVRATVDALFDAMRAADGEALRSLFTDDARLMSAVKPEGQLQVRQTPIDQFVGGVAGASPGSLDERIWDVMIHVDGPLATAWTPYAFYHNGQLSHCGVNAFQLVSAEGGWKILQITDTRQREGCEVPESVQPN